MISHVAALHIRKTLFIGHEFVEQIRRLAELAVAKRLGKLLRRHRCVNRLHPGKALSNRIGGAQVPLRFLGNSVRQFCKLPCGSVTSLRHFIR